MPNAITTYSTAKGYVQSAYLITCNPIRLSVAIDLSLVLSYHLLLGFAVELYLKAFLQNKGLGEDKLRTSDVRHSLSKLLQMCEAHDMPNSVAKSLVDYLDAQHGNFEYRYVQEHGSYNVRWQTEVFAELNALDKFVDGAVGASTSKGLTPGIAGWIVPTEYNGWRIPKSG